MYLGLVHVWGFVSLGLAPCRIDCTYLFGSMLPQVSTDWTFVHHTNTKLNPKPNKRETKVSPFSSRSPAGLKGSPDGSKFRLLRPLVTVNLLPHPAVPPAFIHRVRLNVSILLVKSLKIYVRCVNV